MESSVLGIPFPICHDEKSIEDFLSQCQKNLNKDGRLILQTVNYDKVLSTDDFSSRHKER